MEGIYFEVKRKSHSNQEQVGSQTDRYPLHARLPQGGLEDGDEEVQYKLQLVGSLPVHPLTTMTMLPWIVAEIRRPRDHEKYRGGSNAGVRAIQDLPVCLRISGSAVRCCLDVAPQRDWDPLHHTVLFEYRPHHIHKLVHNSQEPSYFGCLAREQSRSTCHVLRSEDHSKVRKTGLTAAQKFYPHGLQLGMLPIKEEELKSVQLRLGIGNPDPGMPTSSKFSIPPGS